MPKKKSSRHKKETTGLKDGLLEDYPIDYRYGYALDETAQSNCVIESMFF